MNGSDTNTFAIGGIGEVLWDVIGEVEKLGGAPINFAFHAGQLGADAYPISSVGGDKRGAAAITELRNNRVTTDHISVIDEAVTGYVLARVDADGVASYNFPDDVAWDRIFLSERTGALASRLDAVCFGSLAQRCERSRRVIRDFLDRMKPDALKIFDLNIRQNFYSQSLIRKSLKRANVLKLNDDEIALIADIEQLHGTTEQQMHQLVERYDLTLAVLTRGGNGSLLVAKESVSDHPGYPGNIVDTIGAGDSFTAATALGLLNGRSLDRINDHANRVASYVCSRKGAMVPLPDEFLNS